MKKIGYLFAFMFPLLAHSQDTGIHFEHTLTWAEVQAKAKTENKYIFADFFTTWCVPCRYMKDSVFPMQNVGEFMNKKFVCIKVQLDSTAFDDAATRAWLNDGRSLSEKYQISAFPTFMIFNPAGEPTHRFVGASTDKEFLDAVKQSLDPGTQYYTLLGQYNNGKKDQGFLLKMISYADNAFDQSNLSKIVNEYLSTQTNLYTKDNIDLIKKYTTGSADKGFEILLHQADQVDAIDGKATSKEIVERIIMDEEVNSYFSKHPNIAPDWKSFESRIEAKYPGKANKITLNAKIIWYQYHVDWHNYQNAVTEYIHKYGAEMSGSEFNHFAWMVFQNCPDMKCVAQALQWSKRSFEGNNTPGFIDTYANILYKLGRKKEAIEWETKAMNFALEGDKKGYAEVIEKMKKGDKTWN